MTLKRDKRKQRREARRKGAKRIFAGLACLLLFTACCNRMNPKSEANLTETKEVSFAALVEALPVLELPYMMWCGLEGHGPLPWIEDVDKRLIGYLPEDVIVMGRLPIDNDLIYIVYGKVGDIIYPYLNIYNKKGERLDSLYLHISYCAADEWERISTSSTINKDHSISMTDTSEYIHYLDTKRFETDSVILKRELLELTDKGLYRKTKSESSRIR